MNNNAIIRSKLGALLDVMEARTHISIFENKDGESINICDQIMVFEAYNMEKWISYKWYDVVGIAVTLGVTTILVEKGA